MAILTQRGAIYPIAAFAVGGHQAHFNAFVVPAGLCTPITVAAPAHELRVSHIIKIVTVTGMHLAAMIG